MTLTDELKILDDKIKANQAQYDLGREAAKISALSSKDLLEKYEYLTGEDLGHRPSVLEKTKFEYSPLGAVLVDNVKKKTNTNKVNIKKKQDKNLIYNSQYSFTKFKDIDEFKELSLDSMYKKLNDLKKKINKLKTVDSQTNENKAFKPKVLENVGDLFNELYYIDKDRYNEEKDGLNTKNKKVFYYKKLRLTDDYQYESEEEKEQHTSKKEPLKKSIEEDASDFNEWVNKKEANIDSEIFGKHFKFQRPSNMFKLLYKANNKKKNIKLENMIKSGLSDLKNIIENMGDEEKENEKPREIKDIVEKILKFNKQNEEGEGLKILTPDQMLSRLYQFL